jgi:predicted dehydrogenase
MHTEKDETMEDINAGYDKDAMTTAPAPSSIRFGIVGAGQISQGAAGELAGMPGIRLVGIADPSAERAGALASKHGATACADLAGLLALGIDAVYIAVPNAMHAPLAVQALDAGVHVILDKPFALSVAQAETVVAAAKRSGKTLMLGMNQRFTREAQRARAMVASGRLGRIYHAKAFWLRRSGSPKIGTWFTNKDLAGGGALLDIGVHVLDLACFALDRFDPVSVTGATYTSFGHRGLGEGGWGMSERSGGRFDVDDFATALIRFSDGMTLQLEASWAMHMREGTRHDVQLYGEDAGLSAISGELFRFGEGKGEYVIEQNPNFTVASPDGSRFRHFIAVLRGQEQPCITPAQSLAVQRIIDGIYASCRTGTEVRLG